jgi:hypothetical protein
MSTSDTGSEWVVGVTRPVTTRLRTARTAVARGMLTCLPTHLRGVMASYSEVQKAVRVEKFRIWAGWLAGNVIMVIIANGTQDIAIVSVVTQVLFVVVFLALTVALFRMTGALNRRAEAARREVLGNDWQ